MRERRICYGCKKKTEIKRMQEIKIPIIEEIKYFCMDCWYIKYEPRQEAYKEKARLQKR